MAERGGNMKVRSPGPATAIVTIAGATARPLSWRGSVCPRRTSVGSGIRRRPLKAQRVFNVISAKPAAPQWVLRSTIIREACIFTRQTLEDPADFEPTFHVNYESKLPWLQITDDLPKYEGTLLHAPDELRDYDSSAARTAKQWSHRVTRGVRLLLFRGPFGARFCRCPLLARRRAGRPSCRRSQPAAQSFPPASDGGDHTFCRQFPARPDCPPLQRPPPVLWTAPRLI